MNSLELNMPDWRELFLASLNELKLRKMLLRLLVEQFQSQINYSLESRPFEKGNDSKLSEKYNKFQFREKELLTM